MLTSTQDCLARSESRFCLVTNSTVVLPRMRSLPIDEIEAFKIATATAAERRWPWLPPYWLDLIGDQWSVRSEGELDVRVDAGSGAVLLTEAPVASLDPVRAFTMARDFAFRNGQSWKPGFALELTPTHWIVGARQSQFGGQLAVNVSHSGSVTAISVNPK